MLGSEPLIRILLTVLFGAILGLETETRSRTKKNSEPNKIGGLRTYTILSLVGGVSGLLYAANEYVLAYITFVGIGALVLAAYILNVQIHKAFGLTTEIAIIITYLIGFLTTSELIDIEVVLVILVLLAFFLSQKRGFGGLIEKINHQEIIDVLKFALVSIVVLPILPNKTYTILDAISTLGISNNVGNISSKILSINIINPFTIWFIVVLISGINLFGYILSRIIGTKKGIILTAIVGGFLSSTSTTVGLAIKSKGRSKKKSRLYAGSALIANAVSFIAISILIALLSISLLNQLIPAILGMFTIGMFVGIVLVLVERDSAEEELKIDYEPFSILPAIKFVAVIVLLIIGIQLLQILDGDILLLIATSASGIIGLDAPTIAVSQLLDAGRISTDLAIAMFLLTNTINFLTKIFFGFFEGSKHFAIALSIGLLVTLLGSLLILV